MTTSGNDKVIEIQTIIDDKNVRCKDDENSKWRWIHIYAVLSTVLLLCLVVIKCHLISTTQNTSISSDYVKTYKFCYDYYLLLMVLIKTSNHITIDPECPVLVHVHDISIITTQSEKCERVLCLLVNLKSFAVWKQLKGSFTKFTHHQVLGRRATRYWLLATGSCLQQVKCSSQKEWMERYGKINKIE